MDTLAEISFSVLVYLDWRQTVEFTQHPDKYPCCFETNPLMGPHPDHERINLVMGGSLLAHAFIATQLPQPYRRWWQFIWIGVEAEVVHSNRRSWESLQNFKRTTIAVESFTEYPRGNR